MTNKSTKAIVDPEQDDLEIRKIIEWRRRCFVELLGEDYPYLNALIINWHVDRMDVKKLLEEGCPAELIPEILI